MSASSSSTWRKLRRDACAHRPSARPTCARTSVSPMSLVPLRMLRNNQKVSPHRPCRCRRATIVALFVPWRHFLALAPFLVFLSAKQTGGSISISRGNSSHPKLGKNPVKLGRLPRFRSRAALERFYRVFLDEQLERLRSRQRIRLRTKRFLCRSRNVGAERITKKTFVFFFSWRGQGGDCERGPSNGNTARGQRRGTFRKTGPQAENRVRMAKTVSKNRIADDNENDNTKPQSTATAENWVGGLFVTVGPVLVNK